MRCALNRISPLFLAQLLPPTCRLEVKFVPKTVQNAIQNAIQNDHFIYHGFIPRKFMIYHDLSLVPRKLE